MKSFNVLASKLDLTHHYLLEASAGTGKTFSIENIILRLLIEGDYPLSLDKILAVTFTRAAVADMKVRVKENLLRILEACQSCLQGKEVKKIPEFLAPFFEEGENVVISLKRRVEHAIADFDQARIYTIHAFCARMLRENQLEGNHLLCHDSGEKDLSKNLLKEIAKDYLRTELTPDVISSTQLEIVLKKYNGIEGLIKNLSYSITSLMPVIPGATFKSLFSSYSEGMCRLKRDQKISGKLLLTDFYQQAKNYKEIGKLEDVALAAERFTSFFDKESVDVEDFNFLIEQKGFWNEIFANKKVRFKPVELTYPDFAVLYQECFGDLFKDASDAEMIFSLLASRCQLMGRRVLKETEQQGFNSLLSSMRQACENPAFVACVRSKFKAVIIDEFQDTDPLQWEIFRLLFPLDQKEWGCLFLVGDPKQSIYSFRQADIYTYLSASQEIPDDYKACLDYNFRSEPALVDALNQLFDSDFIGNFIQLPRSRMHIPYTTVKAGGKVENLDFGDGLGSIDIQMISKTSYSTEGIDRVVFPFIAQEIKKIHEQHLFKLSAFAVLVADKHQGDRLIRYLREWNIPAVYQKAPDLSESKAVRCMRELLTALVNPKDENSLKIALGGSIIGWTHHQIRSLDDSECLESVLEVFFSWKQILHDGGFASFFEAFMQTSWKIGEDSIENSLLAQEDSETFYNEWVQLADWLTEQHPQSNEQPEKLIDLLIELEETGSEGSDLKIQTISDENAVQVLTIHSSKGLEFEIVFPVGLYKRSTRPGRLIPSLDSNGSYCQKVVDLQSNDFLEHCEELDAEKMRQLYVAATRAKHRLYLFFVFAKIDARSQASPIELFSARCQAPESKYEDLYEQISVNSADSLRLKLDPLLHKASISFSVIGDKIISIHPLEGRKLKTLVPPKSFEMPGSPSYLKSYTLLAKPTSHNFDSLIRPPNDFLNKNHSPHTLPAGSEVGILLHGIMEKVCFSEVSLMNSSKELIDFVALFTEGTSFKGWNETIAEIIFNALKTPFFEGVPVLSEIADTECYREMEFVFPAGEAFGFDGYLKGVIDLVFRWEDRFYMVDWKSNWLGVDATAYSQEMMNKVMGESDYFLQARIYKEALKRYLRLVECDHFGGTAYVFLRGLTNESGVYVVDVKGY